jgi:hypothetical protein
LASGVTFVFTWPTAKQNEVVAHETAPSRLCDPPAGGAETDQAVPFHRSVNDSRLEDDTGSYFPTATQAALLVQATAPKVPDWPTLGCVTVVHFVPFQLWIHVRSGPT